MRLHLVDGLSPDVKLRDNILVDSSLPYLSAEIPPSQTDMADFPFGVAGNMAWVPDELERENIFTVELDESHVEELEHAMDIFKGSHNCPDSLHPITDICACRSWSRWGLHLP